MLSLIKKILKEFRITYAFILRFFLPVQFYFIRKSLNFPKINLLYKSKFDRNVKFWLSSVTLKDKKFTAFRVTPRYFRYYKAFLKTSFTSVILNSNNKKKTFYGSQDPKLFKYKNKILLYLQKSKKFSSDCEISLYDTSLNKTYNINSPFKHNGKNWVPISGINSLIFIYSIDPLVLLKVVDLNKGKMKTINKIKKGTIPEWNTKNILDSPFTKSLFTGGGSKRGGSPMVKVGNNTYLGIGHSSKNLFNYFRQIGSTQRAYIYLFDFKKKIYYINYLTNNKINHLYCTGAELTHNKNIIKFNFSYSSILIEYIVSNIYLFDIELDKRELIKIAKKGVRKKINLITGHKNIN